MKRFKKASIILASIIALIAASGYIIFQLPQFGGSLPGNRLERFQRSPQFIHGRFENTPPQQTDLSFFNNLKLYSQGQIREPQFTVPVVQLEANTLKNPPGQGLRTIWLGHATVLVEINGLRIMTDPVLSEVASPVPIGPHRLHPSPIALESLSGIDAVVISHDHYDHLDMQTIQHLASQGTHFYVGLGVGAHLERWQVAQQQIHEMDWWEPAQIKGVTIICTPARHYSGRKSMDNSTLWASWLLQGGGHSLYFSGDTGYGEHFKQIRERFGAVDVSLMKVGAYGDTWLDIHMNPESAVQAQADLGGKILLPVHWATFNLSYHAWDEPMLRTLAAAKSKGIAIITPQVGEPFEAGKPFENKAWYKP